MDYLHLGKIIDEPISFLITTEPNIPNQLYNCDYNYNIPLAALLSKGSIDFSIRNCYYRMKSADSADRIMRLKNGVISSIVFTLSAEMSEVNEAFNNLSEEDSRIIINGIKDYLVYTPKETLGDKLYNLFHNPDDISQDYFN